MIILAAMRRSLTAMVLSCTQGERTTFVQLSDEFGQPDGPTAMTDRDPLLAAPIGTLSTEAKQWLVEEVGLGSNTFEWFEGGHFVVLHSDNEPEPDRDATCVTGRAHRPS
jgi:hypothetical protein